MTEEDVVAYDAVLPADHKRKLESEVLDQDAGSIDHSNEFSVNEVKESSDSFQAKRPKLDQEAAVGLGNAKSQENDTPTEKGKEDSDEEQREVTEKLTEQKDDNQDGEAPVEEVQEPVHAEETKNMMDDVDQLSIDNGKHEDNQLTSVEAATSQEGSFEESKEVKTGSSQMNIVDESKEANDTISQKEVDDQSKEMNGVSQKKDYDETMEAHDGGSQKEAEDKSKEAHDGGSQKEAEEKSKEANGRSSHKEIGDGGEEVEDTQSTTRRIEVPSSKVGVLIGKGGETIRYLQFNSGAKIQIMRDAEADPNAALRPVEIIGNVACFEKAERLIKAVIAESEAGGSPALVARGFRASHVMGVSEQMEIKVPNDKVGVIIGRGGETIKSMQTKSRARIQLIPQHAEGDGSKERTVRISGDKRQIDIAAAMIKDVMYQDGRPSHFPGGFDQSRGRGGPHQWDSRGPHMPHQMPYDHRHGGPYPSQGSHFRPPSSGDYYPPHMPPRSGYGPGWDQRPPHSGSYDYYGRQGAQTSGQHPTPAPRPTPGPSPALGPPPEANYGYRYGQGPDYAHPAPYSQAGAQHNYGQIYDQPKYDNPYSQQPYGGYGGSQQGFPAAGGQPGYPQMQHPGRSYGMQGPAEQGYGPPRPAAVPGDVPYKGATPVVPSYGTNMSQQQQYGYASSAPGQQTYSSYSSAVPSDGYNGTQAPATTTGYEQHGGQPASGHDQSGVQQASVGYGQVPPTGGYSSYSSTQPGYGNTLAQNNGNYGHTTTSQYPGYGGGNTNAYAPPGGQPAYSQTAPPQAGYEQSATQTAGYTAAPGTAQ